MCKIRQPVGTSCVMQGAQPGASVTTYRGGMGLEMGGRFKREGTFVYLWLIHVDVWRKLTQHCEAIILQLKKNSQKTRIDIFPKETEMANMHVKSHINIANYQRSGNQNHNEISHQPVRKTIIKKTTDNKCWRGCGDKGTLVHCWWEFILLQPLWKTVWRFLKNLKIVLPYDLAIALPGIYLKEKKH